MIRLVSLDVDGFKNLLIKNLTFPREGTILFMGKNESGKSSVFEAIFFALTSTLPKKKVGFTEDICYGKNVAIIDLKFEKDGKVARIRKKISRTGTKVWIEFWVDYEVDPDNKEEGNKKNIDPIIEEFLNFDRDILLNSCFVQQKGLDKFMEEEKQKRKNIINKLLNMERISEMVEEYKKKEIKNVEVCERYFGALTRIERNDKKKEAIKRKVKEIEVLFDKSEDLKSKHNILQNYMKIIKSSVKMKKILIYKSLKKNKKFKKSKKN